MRSFFKIPAGMLGTFHKTIDVLLGVGILILLYYIFSPTSLVSNFFLLMLLCISVAVLTIVCFHVAGVYRDWSGADIVSECNRIVVSVLAVFGSLLILGYIFKISSVYSRLVVLTWVFAWPFLLCVERVIIRKFFFNFFFESSLNRKAVIAGTGKLGSSLAEWFEDNPWVGVRVEGFFGLSDFCDGMQPCLGELSSLPGYVREHDIQLVYIALPMRAQGVIEELLAELEDSTVQIYFFPDMSIFRRLIGGDVAHVAGQAAIVLRSSPFVGMNGFIKRVEDLVLGSIILILISPVMIIIALGIKLSSKGPVFFKQWRYGLGGEPFRILKFRTMKVLEDGYDFAPATQGDPRITRFGRFLRRNSLDELPQFLNVVLGSMSIVGPRPHAVKMNEEYRTLVSGYMLRHISKPGITGLAQINGCRGEVQSHEDMVRRISYDIEYLQRWSVFLDFEIVFKTVFKFAWRQ
ncbi:undecaprenyl-phosphate glucose phosphotransferase [Maridesulfovibrio sp.]|uniref:undecaprenyl-phosphate glucose phosphotransferase n=1 Tax=Maridesulfovibrio sp. TaxID=2795000 RepID=UPI002A18B12A|nr:undecaprenyl-phosphate glucose phosphotransferase [Maridesulfovibrio sp.]